ncbi:hypothetical protein [Myxococcus sp. NMCA1]|uniref:hypothetical protein n=1 Tax=Myxococcus sp. NMCA1 TaxID=2996785 RepID=UPI002285ED90|nr:hypothetical protein [Myxococcus sp. NMCA1]WAM26930.1 hypothetical protein OZ403_02095 [Myxococcus sp. NMCA1]
MLVSGEHPREVDPTAEARALACAWWEVDALPPGLTRHAALVSLLIRAGEWAQGVLDAEQVVHQGEDGDTVLARACESTLLALGHAVVASWTDGFRADLSQVGSSLETLGGLGLPQRVRCKVPRGYALQGLYPESYLASARALPKQGGPCRVVGIRGIGTGLAGVVAAALGTQALCFVRPRGHPYRRTLSLSPERTSQLVDEARAGYRFVVVDEGPGRSGSSFGAVAEFLEARGVAPSSLYFLPGHGGDVGPHATPRHRELWRRAQRGVVDFESVMVTPTEPSHALASWVEDVTGKATAPLEDLGAGGWRKYLLHDMPKAAWPPVHRWRERRKYLLRAGGRPWLLKFAGLGSYGARAYLKTRVLADAGLGVPVSGLKHGFLVQPWLEEARPLSAVGRGVDRWELVARVGAYLGFRSRHFGRVEEGCGASTRELWEMARYNTEVALGREVAQALHVWMPRLGALERMVRRTVTDNRMHAWEWLVLPGGRVLKVDAVDHHWAHDLVGCQDLSWDLAGAAVELSLDSEELAALCAVVERHKGRLPPLELLRFHRQAYLAFQLGDHALAAESYDAHAPDEAARLRHAAARYAELLRRELAPASSRPLMGGVGVGARM